MEKGFTPCMQTSFHSHLYRQQVRWGASIKEHILKVLAGYFKFLETQD